MRPKSNEIQIVRTYDAPVELVWKVWTDLKHVEKWWGPRGFTLTTKSQELRPGGKWIFTMHAPDGTSFPNIATFREVVKYQKLVYDHGTSEEQDKLFSVTVTFEEKNGKTVMTMTTAFPIEQEAQAAKKFIKDANGNSTWDRLAEYLENEAFGKDVFIINRTFKADIRTMFEMWANPEHLAKWLGPAGSKMSYVSVDAREGGTSHFKMTDINGAVFYGKLHFKEIRPPHHLVYTQIFSDENGNLTKHPYHPTWPDELLTTVTFAEEGPEETRVTVKWEIYGKATDEERRTFKNAKIETNQGWNSSFDKIDQLLEQEE